MDVTKSPVWKELVEAKKTGEKPVFYTHRCEITIDEETLEVPKLLQIDTRREYSTKFNDETVIKIMMIRRDYIRWLYPNRDNFIITMFKEPKSETEDQTDVERNTKIRYYRGALIDSKSPLLEGTVEVDTSDDMEDGSTYVELYVQLISLPIEMMRMMTVGGIYEGLRTDKFIQGMFTYISGKLDVPEDVAIDGVDLVEGDNDHVRDHIIVPHGTKLMSLPDYIQKEQGGVYKHDLGFYLQDNFWYVFPLYNKDRFDKTPRNLTVFNIPPNRMPGIERTYYLKEERVTVIATGKTKHIDDSEYLQNNVGNGVRFAAADYMLEGYHDVDGNKASMSRKRNMSEVMVKNRRTEKEMALMSEDRITANSFKEISALSRRDGAFIQTNWENANPDLIYPGMPVRYVYIEDDSINEVFGVVLGADFYTHLKGQGMTANRYRTNVTLTLFIENITGEG